MTLLRLVGPFPLQYLDAVAVRVADEEAIRRRDLHRLVYWYTEAREVGPSRPRVWRVQAEMPRANRIRLRLLQEVNVGAAEVVPDRDETELHRGRDFLQPEYPAIEISAPGHIRDDNRAMIDVGEANSTHGRGSDKVKSEPCGVSRRIRDVL